MSASIESEVARVESEITRLLAELEETTGQKVESIAINSVRFDRLIDRGPTFVKRAVVRLQVVDTTKWDV